MFLVKSLIRNKLRRKFPQWSLLAGHCFGTCLKMPFGSLYFQGFQTAGLGNSATLDSGLRRKSIGFFWPWFSFLGNSATLDSGLRLSFFRFRRNRVSVPRKQCHVRQWIKTNERAAWMAERETRKQCHVRQWIVPVCKYK